MSWLFDSDAALYRWTCDSCRCKAVTSDDENAPVGWYWFRISENQVNRVFCNSGCVASDAATRLADMREAFCSRDSGVYRDAQREPWEFAQEIMED